MKIKTSELTGAALDWAVEFAIASQFNEGRKLQTVRDVRDPTSPCWIEVENYPGADLFHRRSASTDWARGGPIIERDCIAVYTNSSGQTWGASVKRPARGYFYQYGPTPLVAAMRCYVASKLGDEVDVPEELCA